MAKGIVMRHFSTRCVVSSILGLVLSVTAANAQEVGKNKQEALRQLIEVQTGGKKAFSEQDAWRTREELNQVINIPSMKEILRLDPSLLNNEAYLAAYPRLAAFLTDHPEVAHNPTYFLGLPESERRNNIAEPLAVTLIVLGMAGLFIWLIRLIVDYRRWLRISRLQTEAQAKILDRFTSNEDLLGFIQTPAGRRFMESSAMPIEPRSIGAPFGRILWSVQIGLILLFCGLGMELLRGSSAVATEGLDEAFLIIGGLVVAIGVGFLSSGLASYLLSRRFGLLNPIIQDVPSGGGTTQMPPSS
jgi:hypothetical protein